MDKLLGFRQQLCALAIVSACVFPAKAADDFLILVSGLGGDPDFQESFDEQAAQLHEAALSLGIDDSRAILLTGEDASKENILNRLSNLNTSNEDLVQLHLIGHGSFDGNQYKFNIPGPDITAVELREALDSITAAQMIAVMTSASGAAMERLRADNRLVITATKSGLQKNASVFSRYWAEGASRSQADLNKNEIVSIAELYAYATEGVTNYYESEGLIASEASLFEGQENLDPDLFNIARVGKLANTSLSANAEALIAERANVEVRLSELSERRQTLTDDQYFAELQDLMLELGLLQQRIDRELEADSE